MNVPGETLPLYHRRQRLGTGLQQWKGVAGRRLLNDRGSEHDAQVPNDEGAIPITDPAHNVSFIGPDTEAAESEREKFRAYYSHGGTGVHQCAYERAGLADPDLEADQGGQKIKELQINENLINADLHIRLVQSIGRATF